MPMNRTEFLNAVIDDGIMEINYNYTKPEERFKKTGGIKGFEACRGKTDQEIVELLTEAKQTVTKARDENGSIDWYWHWVMYQHQIEWVLNVLSAAYHLHNQETLIPVTSRGMLKAVMILTP